MIKKERTRLRELGPVIKSNMLTLRSKKALIESCIFPIVYYGSENWRTNESLIRKLEVPHNACTRTARNVDKKDHIRMDSISIGLDHPMNIVAKRRLLFHVPLATGEGQLCVQRILKSTMKCNRKIAGRSKQKLEECLRIDAEWLFGETASVDSVISLLADGAQLRMRDRLDHLIRNRSIVGRKTEDLPKLIKPRMKMVQCHYELCKKAFAEQKELNRHIKMDHETAPDKQKPYPCQYCSRSYASMGWLTRHYKTDHTEEANQSNQIQQKHQRRKAGDCCDGDLCGGVKLIGDTRKKEDNPTITSCIQVRTVDTNVSTNLSETISLEVLNFRLTDLSEKGNFNCPFAGCSKSTGTAKGMLNHGTSEHGWSFFTGGPKRHRKRKADNLVGGLSGGC